MPADPQPLAAPLASTVSRPSTAGPAVRGLAARPLWKACRNWTSALVLASFPFLFIVDRAVETRISPVLPGLLVLALALLLMPFAAMEAAARLHRRRDAAWHERRAHRHLQTSRAALALAAAWTLVWFLLGA